MIKVTTYIDPCHRFGRGPPLDSECGGARLAKRQPRKESIMVEGRLRLSHVEGTRRQFVAECGSDPAVRNVGRKATPLQVKLPGLPAA